MFDDYFRQYGLIGMFVVVAVVTPVAMLVMSYLATFVRIRAKRPTPA